MRRFIPFLLFLFIIAAIWRIELFFNIAYLFFAVYLLARLWTRRSLRHLTVQRIFTERAFAGDTVSVKVWVRNTGALPVPWLQVHESLPVDLIAPPFHVEVFSLGAHAKRYFAYDLRCQKRGVYRIGPLQAQTGDLLGLESPQTLEARAQPLIVYPQIVPLARLDLPTRSPLVALPARSPLFEDAARVTGVRGYQRGDSPRRIHWTATAGSGQLLVKQYQPAIARETLICLDLNGESYETRERYDATELAVVAAASIAHHIILSERLPAGLAAEALDALSGEPAHFFLPPRSERAHLMGLLETLARAQLTKASAFPEVLRRLRPRLAWGATLVVITGRQTEALLDALAAFRQSGFAVALLLCRPARAPVELQRRAALLGVPAHSIWSERDLQQWPLRSAQPRAASAARGTAR